MIRLGKLVRAALVGTANAGSAIVAHRSSNAGIFGVTEKEDNKGPQTQADLMSQVLMVEAIATEIPELLECIVAEEGKITMERKQELLDLAPPSVASLPSEIEILESIPKEYEWLETNEISIFIDPMDGTKEYIKGSSTVPMAMFGICYKHKPIAGILYQPFLNKFTVGIVGKGCFQINKGKLESFPNYASLTEKIVTTSNSNYSEPLREMIERLCVDKIIREGGAGYKVLSILEKRASIYCYPSRGTSLWDSCAPEACVIAHGGMLTDCRGDRINYNMKELSTTENMLGILATGLPLAPHTELAKKLRF